MSGGTQDPGADRPRKKQPTGDYEVGYGRPPTATRWKPGQSGNPGRGRRKGTRNFKTDLLAALKEPVQVKRGGRARKVSSQEAMLLRLREKALQGDPRALDRMLAFAQHYNDEEPHAATGELSADDAAILATFAPALLEDLERASAPKSEAAEQEGAGDDQRGRPQGDAEREPDGASDAGAGP